MKRITSRLGIAIFGLVWLGLAGQVQAWDRPPVKVNTVFKFDVEVKVGPDGMRPTAPWLRPFGLRFWGCPALPSTRQSTPPTA